MADVMIQPADMPSMSPSTPSPATSAAGSSTTTGTSATSATPAPSTTSSSSAARRPPRKSTLTQQQKLHKRQRATTEQLSTLELEFNSNPTPNAMVRDRIAQEISMTERSVQIWFQNRRAKIKHLAKKSIETGEDCDAIPASMRKYLALQAFESGRQVPPDMFGNGAMAGFHGGLFMNTESAASKVAIQHFNCRSLSIGTWRRVGQAALDLVVFYAPEKSWVTYYINADAHGFRIEYPFSYIKNITLDAGDTSTEGASDRTGGLIVELNRPPHFSMDPGSGGFFQCRDFTEDHQASHTLTHYLGGHPKVLSGQLAKLVSLESFRNRHRPHDTPANNAMNPPPPVSAPVSPVGPNRPSSQPNHIVHPHATPVPEMPPSTMSLQPARGHKRQRSRSVPAAIDFSAFRPSFAPNFYPPAVQTPAPTDMCGSHIFAPVPQHAPMQYPGMSNLPPTLSVESPAPDQTFEFQAGAMSSTTANSPSEYEPTFFTSGPPSEHFTATNLNTPFTGPFLSPMADPSHNLQPSISPLSAMSHGDPIIANQSPPLVSIDRSASADLYPVQDSSGFGDDTFNFDDMYNKQAFTLPFRSSFMDEHTEEFDMHNSFVSYGTIDPAALTPNPDHNGTTYNSHR